VFLPDSRREEGRRSPQGSRGRSTLLRQEKRGRVRGRKQEKKKGGRKRKGVL